MVTSLKVQVARLFEGSRELALEAITDLRRPGSTMMVWSSFEEGLAGLVSDLVVETRDELVRATIVQMRRR